MLKIHVVKFWYLFLRPRELVDSERLLVCQSNRAKEVKGSDANTGLYGAAKLDLVGALNRGPHYYIEQAVLILASQS